MLADMREEVDAAAYEYRKLVDQLEETRRELLELRATEVWVSVYPPKRWRPSRTQRLCAERSGAFRGRSCLAWRAA
jgi:hypothetical protein